MAELVTIGGSGSIFVGEDKLVLLELFSKADSAVAVNLAGMTTLFDVRAKDNSPDPAILSVTPLTLQGTFDAIRASNTQRARVPLTRTQLLLFKEKGYRWSWSRTDNGSSTVFAWGDFGPQKATGR